MNENHACILITHDEKILRWNRSLKRWDRKQKQVGTKKYSVKDHMDWIDVNNIRISHFGIDPNLLRRNDIRFDVFHLRCAITRRLMVYL